MLGFALLCAAIVATGYGIVRRLYDAPRLELLVSGALAGTILWIAANWALAITFTLTRRNLLIVAGAFVAAGIWSAATALPLSVRWRAWSVGAMVAIALWCAFVLWRASVVPPASHDVLTYHLPKAVMMARAHGYERFDVPDFRIATFPSNYELLLTDVLLLGDGDRLTEWIGTVSYLLLLGVVAVAARRWWGQGVHVVASVMAAAGAPLLLLHSGHDKNDIMTAAFAAAALLWSARWCAERGAMPAMLAIACGATAVGTKITAGPVVLGIAPFGIAALLRKPPRPKALTAALLFAVCAFLLCGGWVFLQNAQAKTLPANVSSGVPMAEYGQWSHLWKVPIMMLRVSLGLSTEWPWPSENLFSSHYGSVFGLAALSLPLCIWTYRREGDEPLRRERTVAGIAAAIAFFILLPLIQYPQLALPSILRYTAFVLPVIYGWTVAPLVRSLAMSRFRRYVHAVMAVLVAIFASGRPATPRPSSTVWPDRTTKSPFTAPATPGFIPRTAPRSREPSSSSIPSKRSPPTQNGSPSTATRPTRSSTRRSPATAASGSFTGSSGTPRRCSAASACRSSRKKKARGFEPAGLHVYPGDVLLSHAVARAVSSAMRSLTAVFGMGTGVSSAL